MSFNIKVVPRRVAVALVIPEVDTAQITAAAAAAAVQTVTPSITAAAADAAKAIEDAALAATKATIAKNAADGASSLIAETALTQAQRDALQDSMAGAIDGGVKALQDRVLAVEATANTTAAGLSSKTEADNEQFSRIASDFQEVGAAIIELNAGIENLNDTLASGVDKGYFAAE